MKRKYTVLWVYALLFAGWIIFGSRASNPPDGRTGAPFDGNCTNCHSPSSSLDGSISITGLPNEAVAGQTYALTFTIDATAGSPQNAGFQMVSVFDDNQSNAGTWISNSSDEGTNSSGGRSYIEHRGAKGFSAGSVSWDFEWQAPEGPDGSTIRMYYVGNICNGNGGSNGDRPRTGSVSLTLAGSTTPLAASISSSSDISCLGAEDGTATVTAEGGASPYDYLWSDGQTTMTASGLGAGSYAVTVTDDNGESVMATVVLSEPESLDVDITRTNVACRDDNSGILQADPSGGTPPYDYTWSNGQNSASIEGLSAGTYALTITDANDCTLQREITVTQPPALTLEMNATAEESAMAEDGSITAMVSGGTGAYTYAWSNGASSASIEGLAPGTYGLTVTDENGCQIEGMAVVDAFVCSIEATVATTSVSCFGGADGVASVGMVNAATPVTYNWSTGGTGSAIQDLSAGMYTVTVTDADQCQVMLVAEVASPDALTLQIREQAPTCPNTNDGSLEVLSVSGGTAPYRYDWSVGDTTALIDSLSIGDYELVITDANGCVDSVLRNLETVDSLAPVVLAQSIQVYADSSGQVDLDVQMIDVGTFDNCTLDSIWLDITSLSCGQDTITLSFSARDAAGNTADTLVSVTVLDTIAPYFLTCVEDIEADSGEVVVYDLPVAFDNCAVDSFELIEGLPSGSVFPVGETKVSYMATDASGNIGCCSFFVTAGMTTSSADVALDAAINIYPNPVEDRAFIKISEDEYQGVLRLELVDSRGAHFPVPNLDRTDDVLAVDMRSFASGIYYLRVVLGGRMTVKKVIKR